MTTTDQSLLYESLRERENHPPPPLVLFHLQQQAAQMGLSLFSFFTLGKLQITPIKFGGVWILQTKILEFGFYTLKFGVFGFYTLIFKNLDFTS